MIVHSANCVFGETIPNTSVLVLQSYSIMHSLKKFTDMIVAATKFTIKVVFDMLLKNLDAILTIRHNHDAPLAPTSKYRKLVSRAVGLAQVF